MAQGDLLLAGIASAMMKATTPGATSSPGTPTAGSSPVTATFTSEQIDQLAGALTDAVSRIQLPAPVVSVPGNLQVSLSDAQISQLSTAISQPNETPPLNIFNRSVQADFTGSQVHALVAPSATGSYPNLVRLASIQFIQDVQLIGIVLSASLLNTGTEPMGLFVARDTGLIINFATPTDPTVRANDIYLSILTHNNSTVGTNAPASRTASIAFSPKAGAIKFKSASTISIYGCAQNLASALMTGVLSVYYITEEPQ